MVSPRRYKFALERLARVVRANLDGGRLLSDEIKVALLEVEAARPPAPSEAEKLAAAKRLVERRERHARRVKP